MNSAPYLGVTDMSSATAETGFSDFRMQTQSAGGTFGASSSAGKSRTTFTAVALS